MDRTRIWEPLDYSKSEIRLLLLKASEDFYAWPQAKIVRQSLDYPAHYEALSYAWGVCQPSMPLFVEREGEIIDVPITADLCKALRHLRDIHEDKCLWLDAICISQSDTKEKEQQIGLMHKIFHRANRVHIWLVPTNTSQEGTLDILSRIPKHTKELANWARSNNAISEITSIGDMKYWSRQWVISEMILGRDLLLHCNSAIIDVQSLTQALDAITRMRDTRIGNSTGNTQFPPEWAKFLVKLTTVLPQAMRSTVQEKELIFLSILHATRKCNVSDPRDRINSLLGLFNSFFNCTDTADYTSTTAEVYTRFARSLICQTKSLRILTLANSYQSSINGLPSWVPDWSSSYDHKPQFHDCETWDVFSAGMSTGKSSSEQIPATEPKSASDPHLLVYTHIAGTVGDMFEPWYTSADPDSHCADMNSTELPFALDHHLIQLDEPTPHELWGTICRTMTGDVDSTQPPPLAPLHSLRIVAPKPDRLDRQSLWVRVDQQVEQEARGGDTVVTDTIGEMLQKNFPGYQRRLIDKRCFSCNMGLGLKWAVGTGPRHTREGDLVAYFAGAHLPFIIRPVTQRPGKHTASVPAYNLMGSCYLNNLMDGELYRDYPSEERLIEIR